MERRIGRITLIGTSHVSPTSVALVRERIQEQRPDLVAIELCQPRYEVLTDRDAYERLPVSEMIKGNRAYLILAQVLLGAYQRRIAQDIGTKPGDEMLAAIEEAQKLGIPVYLIDRPISITLKRAWVTLGFWGKLRFLFYLWKSLLWPGEEIDPEQLLDEDVMTQVMEEMRMAAPTIARVLIDERDSYLAIQLQRVADPASGTPQDAPDLALKEVVAVQTTEPDLDQEGPPEEIDLAEPAPRDPPPEPVPVSEDPGELPIPERPRVVAVVGAGHVNGILEHLERPAPQDPPQALADLREIRERRFPLGKVIGFGLMGAILTYMWFLFMIGDWSTLWDALLIWFLVNGVLAALGAAVAGGHPLTILSAFLAAPFTSLNPMIAAGWIAGLVELKMRTPVVKDIEALSELVVGDSLLDLFRNPVMRILAVTAMANIGSMIGTWVAATWILTG